MTEVELAQSFVMFVVAAVKNIYGFIMGLGFPMGPLVLLCLGALGFFIYQGSEHTIASGVTRFLISAIIVTVIAFGLTAFMFHG